MSLLARMFSPLNHSAREHREANRQQTEMLLEAELEYQYELMNSTDPAVRERALDEIDRINTMLRAT